MMYSQFLNKTAPGEPYFFVSPYPGKAYSLHWSHIMHCFKETNEKNEGPSIVATHYTPFIIRSGLKTDRETCLVEDHYRRRHEQFAIKYGWEEVRADGMEQDGYDRFGRCDYVLLANALGQVGAGCRLIWSTPTLDLPISKLLDNSQSVPLGSVEISRITGTPESAKHSLEFLGHLLTYLHERGVTGFYVTIRRRLLERYRHSGFDCYETLPGKALEKTSRTGNKEYFLPVWIGVKGYQQAFSILSHSCA